MGETRVGEVVVFALLEDAGVEEGNSVFVKSQGKDRPPGLGRVVATVPGKTHKWVVHCDTGRVQRHVPQAKLTKRFAPQPNERPTLVIVGETADFRALARTQPEPSDVVVEIGASFYCATRLLSQAAGRVVALDCSPVTIGQAPALPNASFHCVDVLACPEELGVVGNGCSCVFLDIGGSRDCESVCRAVCVVFDQLSPRLVVVKSRKLFRDARHHMQRSGAVQCNKPMPNGAQWWEQVVASFQVSNHQ